MAGDGTRYVLRSLAAGERERWDEFVMGHPMGHLLQSWAWGDLKATGGWHPLRLALWDAERGTMLAGAQVLRRTAAALPLWVGHLAYIPRGPVIDWSQAAMCEAFFAQLDMFLRQEGALELRMEPGAALDTDDGKLAAKRLAARQTRSVRSIQPLRTIVLDLEADEETLLARMKEKWRYNVRLAGRKGVRVRVAESREDVRAWYGLLRETSARDHFGIHTLDYYLHAWELLGERRQARLLLAEHEGQLLAGIFVGLCAREAIYLYGASSNERRHLMPNYLLQWEALRWAKQQGALRYDFWGIPETDAEDEAMAGVYRFKRGWGGRVVQFPGGYERAYRPLALKLAHRFLHE